jgi:hypothetical protein
MTFNKKHRTDALLSSMGHLRGFLSAFHMHGNFYRTIYSEKDSAEIDREALEADWGSVGDDMSQTLDKMKKKYFSSKPK